jgi:hypothetical protein
LLETHKSPFTGRRQQTGNRIPILQFCRILPEALVAPVNLAMRRSSITHLRNPLPAF